MPFHQTQVEFHIINTNILPVLIPAWSKVPHGHNPCFFITLTLSVVGPPLQFVYTKLSISFVNLSEIRTHTQPQFHPST